MGRRIVWEDVTVRIYIEEEELGIYFATSLSIEEILEVDRAKFQGASTPSLDATYGGARGTFEFILDDDFGDPRDVYERHKEPFQTRLPGGNIRAVVSHRIPGSESRESLRITGMIVNQSDRVGDGQRWTVSWSFDAEGVKRIAA